MATKQKNIFTRSKPLMNIYSGVDHEGKEVEVREDAEQLVKWHEISDALVAAGYYRAQLQGLSAFDKIVGGLTWCIELCDIDVDVSLLFEENLTIGKKIALTEKIVKILPTMNCPYTIEPHQIQGLDFINIYPLILWLIKYSSEFREAKEDELRKFAVMQYDKSHIFESDRAAFMLKEKLLKNLAVVQNLYKPCRVRKRKGGFPVNELEQVNATLSEYDQRMLMHVTTNKGDAKSDDGLDFLYDYEKTLADPTEITTEAGRYEKDEGSKETHADAKIHYAVLQSELTGEVSKELEEREKQKYSEDVDRLTKSIDVLTKDIKKFKETHQERMESTKTQHQDMLGKMKKITNKLMKSDGVPKSDKDVKQFYKSLKELARERNELLQVIQHRNIEHSHLEDKLRAAKDPDAKVEEQPLTLAELKEFNERQEKLKAFITRMRLELAKLNREVLRYSTAIDEVPGTAELLQYEKRFIELYNQVFETYQKARMVFVQTMAELATRSTNVKCLESAGVLDLLRPLLSDACSTVRQCAVVAAARLAEHDEGVARQLLNGGVVTITLENLNKYNVYYKRSALYLMRAVAKHNEELAGAIIRLGALEHIVSCLEDFDTQVKENAAWALGYIGKHSEQLSGLVVDAGTLPLLVLAFQEPEMSLKQIAAGALVDLAQHKPEAVVDAGAICHLVHGLENQDPKLKRSTLCALGAVAGARTELAEAVVAGGALPPALLHAGHDAAPVRKAAACLLRDIVKHSVDLAQLVVNTGGCGPLVELLGEPAGGVRVPACMALGFIAGQSDQLAMAVIESKAIPSLVEILQNPEAEDAEICAAAWTLGHIAKHSPQHSLAIAVANALPRLLQLYTHPKSSGEVRARASCALKQALQCCLHRPALEPLLHSAPACILKYVLAQYAKILPNDARARRLFVTTGALKRVQEIDSVPGSSLKEYINIINSCFPEEIVRYYTPGYSDSLLDRVEAYTPQIPELFTDRVPSDCQSEISVEQAN